MVVCFLSFPFFLVGGGVLFRALLLGLGSWSLGFRVLGLEGLRLRVRGTGAPIPQPESESGFRSPRPAPLSPKP